MLDVSKSLIDRNVGVSEYHILQSLCLGPAKRLLNETEVQAGGGREDRYASPWGPVKTTLAPRSIR
jgi:hypothetical protein